jgi:hypothetical protein
MKLESSEQIFKKFSNFKLHETPSSGSRVVSYRWADVTKPTASFHSVVNAPNN